eukprot:symbB.v1.2.031710.t1/scaffold3711.1/size51609/3
MFSDVLRCSRSGVLARLAKMQRGPLPETEMMEVAVSLWLGDFVTAKALLEERFSEPGILHALEQLLAEMPRAETASAAFVPRKVSEVVARQKLHTQRCSIRVGSLMLRDGTAMGYVLLLKESTSPLLVRFGGNAELAALSAQSELKTLVEKGLCEICLLDYRGFGWSGGRASMASLRCDAQDAMEALPKILSEHERSMEGRGVVLFGRSIGSLCAMHLAILGYGEGLILDSPAVPTWPQLAAVIPTLNVPGRCRVCMCCGAKAAPAAKLQESRERSYLETEDLLRGCDIPLLYINGTEDVVCPHQQALPCFEAASCHPKRLLLLEGKGHNEVANAPEYWQAMEEFLLQAAVDGQLRACTCSFDRKLRHYNIIISKETRSIPLNKFREVFQGTEPDDIATPLDELCATMVTPSEFPPPKPLVRLRHWNRGFCE